MKTVIWRYSVQIIWLLFVVTVVCFRWSWLSSIPWKLYAGIPWLHFLHKPQLKDLTNPAGAPIHRKKIQKACNYRRNYPRTYQGNLERSHSMVTSPWPLEYHAELAAMAMNWICLSYLRKKKDHFFISVLTSISFSVGSTETWCGNNFKIYTECLFLTVFKS